MNPKVSIIILNWNGWKDTIECLESLYQITYPNYDVIVVDNGSEDESIEKIKEYAEGKIKVESKFFEYDPSNKPIKIIKYTREKAEAGGGKEKEIADLSSNKKLIIIKNEKNYGFAKGANIGMRYGLATGTEGMLLLNNDMVVDKEFLSELVKIADNNSRIGVATPKVYYYSEQDRIQFCAARIDLWTGRMFVEGINKLDVGQHEQVKEVDYGHGGCSLIRREVLETVGLLDAGYFLYWEDMDYWFRARSKGYKIIYTPGARVWHKGGATSLKTGLHPYYSTKGRFRFIAKHAASVQLVSFFFLFFCFELWLITVSELIHRRGRRVLSIYKGAIEGILLLIKYRLRRRCKP
jgi:GT2 family glycosyltransferase